MNVSKPLSLTALSLAALIGCSLSLMSAFAQKTKQTQPTPQSKISPVQAIKIALAKVPGHPLQANFEFDEGKWVYGVMIVNGKTIKEVEIDPMTGKIGATETVTPDDEAKEMHDMLSKAIGGKASSHAEKEDDEKDEKPEKPEKPLR